MRQPYGAGQELLLGGICYRIEGLEGFGSSAVVYRASYEDGLTNGSRHQVLLKELFPLTRDDSIRRGPEGALLVEQSAEALMDRYRERFLAGNRANLSLLDLDPTAAAGNINSFSALGTYYTILPIHGGENLLNWIRRREGSSMEESVRKLLLVSRALELFHSNGLLHLDISPDNVLMLPEKALLIDYNSVWDMNSRDWEDFPFSEKQGYCAPEVKLRETEQIGFHTDLYSLCALFYHLLTGSPLGSEVLTGRGLSFPQSLVDSWQVSPTAAHKAVQILMKGLHPLPRKRYRSIGALQSDLQELLRRIQGKGVTASALWELSCAGFRQGREETTPYWPQAVGLTSGERWDMPDLIRHLGRGSSLVLTGPGGMGKTRYLHELWKKACARWDPRQPVTLYVSLRDYQQCPGDGNYILHTILRSLRFSEEAPDYADALHALEALFAAREPGVVLLLDGLNEAGPRTEPLLGEIERLAAFPGIGVLVTDRSQAVLDYGLKGFGAGALCPLEEAQVAAVLDQAGLQPQPQVRALLSNPMMLRLYLDTRGEDQPDSHKALIRLYLKNFCRNALRADSGDQTRQLRTQYLLTHLLPEIAGAMEKRSVLTVEEMGGICKRSYLRLRKPGFEAAFPEYKGLSRKLLEGVANDSEWYDLAVRELLVDRFGLLERTDRGNFRLLHDNFQETLASAHRENSLALRRALRRRAIPRLAALGAAMAAVLCLVFWGLGQSRYTRQEQYHIRDANNCLVDNLGQWARQITSQRDMLKEADHDILVEKDPHEMEKFQQVLDQKQRELNKYTPSPLRESLSQELDRIEERTGRLDAQLYRMLCSRAGVLEENVTGCLQYLALRLCHEDYLRVPVGDQEQLLRAYETYLDAEENYLFCSLAALLETLPQEEGDRVRTALGRLPPFDTFRAAAGTMTEQELSQQMAAARYTLENSANEMISAGFPLIYREDG